MSQRDISEVLHSIGVASRFENMERALRSIKRQIPTTAAIDAPVAIEPTGENKLATLQDATALLEAEMASLRDQLVEFADKVDRYETWADESLPQMLSIADAAVTDQQSADDATRIYNANWFSRLLLSQEAKMRFARHLLRAVRQYTKSNTDTLRMIGEGDPEMMAIIAKPIDD